MVRILAVALWCAFVAVLGASVYAGLNPPEGDDPIALTDMIWAVSIIGFPTAGALIATKLPRRPLGWILLVSPLSIMTGVFLGDGPVDFLPPDQARYYAVAANGLFIVGLTTLMTVPLFIPDGKLRSSRWMPVVWAVAVGATLLLTTAILEPGPMPEYPEFVNPVGVQAFEPIAAVVRKVEGLIYLSTLGAGMTSVVLRFRTARGRERQQLKWLVLGLGAAATAVLTSAVLIGFGVSVPEVVVTLVFVIAFLSLPVSIAIAILRDRLYDVDVIINRALVYGALTAVLVGLYLLTILVIQGLLPLSSDSDLGVAASTLLVAGLFRPARRRMQSFIDKRFYRRKYDAAATVAAFSARLRDEVELERIRDDVVGVVVETVQPAHTSIWLRGTA